MCYCLNTKLNNILGLNAKKKKVYWDEFALEYNNKEKVEKGVPFVLMGKKIFDCHHGKDRSIAMKKRAEQRRQEVNAVLCYWNVYQICINYMSSVLTDDCMYLSNLQHQKTFFSHFLPQTKTLKNF